MTPYLVFIPDKDISFLGRSRELIFCLPWVDEFIDMCYPVLVLQTILYSIKLTSGGRGYSGLTWVFFATPAVALASSVLFLAGVSVGGRYTCVDCGIIPVSFARSGSGVQPRVLG